MTWNISYNGAAVADMRYGEAMMNAIAEQVKREQADDNVRAHLEEHRLSYYTSSLLDCQYNLRRFDWLTTERWRAARMHERSHGQLRNAETLMLFNEDELLSCEFDADEREEDVRRLIWC